MIETSASVARACRLTGLALAIFCAAMPLQAQVLAGESAQAESKDAPEEIIIRRVQMGKLLEGPSPFITVIETETYQGEDKTLADLLATSVGVQLRRFGGEGERSEISIRGSTASQVIILMDGVRLDGGQAGSVDLSTIPLELIERIEVSRGSGSIRTGSGAMGGVVNIITKKPSAEPVSSFSLSGGSFDTYRASLFRSDQKEKFDYSLGYSGFSTDGDYDFERPTFKSGGITIKPNPASATRINNDSEHQALDAKIGRDFDFGRLQFSDNIMYMSRGEPGLASGPGVNAGQQAYAHERTTRNLAKLDWTTEGIGEFGTSANASVFHRYERAHFKDPFPSLGNPIDVETKDSTLGIALFSDWAVDFENMGNAITLVADARRDRLSTSDRSTVRRDSAAMGIQEEASFGSDQLTLVAGARYEDTEGYGGQWLPRAGLVLEPWYWLRFKANTARTYRIPSFDELYYPNKGFARGNPDLVPEKSHNSDVGVEVNFDQVFFLSAVRLSGSIFHNEVEESIVWMVINPTTISPRNTGDATIDGVELLFSADLGPFLALSANYTDLDATLDKTDADLPGRADNETNVRLTLTPFAALKLVGELHEVGDISVSEAGNVTVPSRTTYDASVAVNLSSLLEGRQGMQRMPDPLWLTLAGTNLGDRSVYDALFFPQPGRSVTLKLEGSW